MSPDFFFRADDGIRDDVVTGVQMCALQIFLQGAVPGAPTAMNRPMQVLPVNVPQIAEPSQPVAQSKLRPLLFPPAAQPDVAAPAPPPASHRTIPSFPLETAILVPPAPDAPARTPAPLHPPPHPPSPAPPP